MAQKDVYERVCGFYDFILGETPMRERLAEVMRELASADDLEAFFLLPFAGALPLSKLGRNARKAGMTFEEAEDKLERLASEAFVMAYTGPQGRMYERGNAIFISEQQVRKAGDAPVGQFFAEFYNVVVETTAGNIPTKTPYYRVLAAEGTLTHDTTSRTIVVDEVIPDPRGVLPVDILTQMIKNDSRLIGVAECYCRKTKQIIGEPCEHPLETCLVFNDLADSLITMGTARKIDVDEALNILWDCEAQGLVHNVDNCLGEIRSLCNCCACSCPVIKTWNAGQTNAQGPSRFVATYDAGKCVQCTRCVMRCPTTARQMVDGHLVYDAAACLGCGLCVSACSEAANSLMLRDRQTKIPADRDALYGKITREAIVGMAKKKLFGQ